MRFLSVTMGLAMFELNLQKLELWEVSKKFVSQISRMTNKFPKSELYGLQSKLEEPLFQFLPMLQRGIQIFAIRKEAIL